MQKNDLRKKAIKSINETAFFPNKGKDRLLSMVEEGQIGAFHVKESGEFLCLSSLTKKQKNL